jgi:tetratricopeptide (TPR) repeat protein
MSLGMCARQRGDFALAERATKRGVELEPSNDYARHLHAEVLRGLGRLDEAIEELRGVVRRRGPAFPNAIASYLEALEQRGRPDDLDVALKTANQILLQKLSPADRNRFQAIRDRLKR